MGGAGAGPHCLPTLGTARLLGSSYLQSRELPLTPSWALTLYDPVKAPSWPHGQRGPGHRLQELGLPGAQASGQCNSLGRAMCQLNPPHTQLEGTLSSPPWPHRGCRARRPLGDGQPARGQAVGA